MAGSLGESNLENQRGDHLPDLVPAEVWRHAVHLAAVRRFEVVVAGRGIAASRCHRRAAMASGGPRAADGSLSLQDRRLMNVLYANAGTKLCDEVTHVIGIAELRGAHKGGERVGIPAQLIQGGIRARYLSNSETPPNP